MREDLVYHIDGIDYSTSRDEIKQGDLVLHKWKSEIGSCEKIIGKNRMAVRYGENYVEEGVRINNFLRLVPSVEPYLLN